MKKLLILLSIIILISCEKDTNESLHKYVCIKIEGQRQLDGSYIFTESIFFEGNTTKANAQAIINKNQIGENGDSYIMRVKCTQY